MIRLQDIRGCGILLLASLALGLAVNELSPSGIPLLGQWDPGKGVVMADPDKFSQASIQEIDNPMTLLRMIQSGNLVLIDARPALSFAQGHLPGALNFPLHEFDERRSELGAVLKPGLPVVVYCSGLDCEDSHKFAARLAAMGKDQVMVYGGGFREWVDMGFEVVVDAG